MYVRYVVMFMKETPAPEFCPICKAPASKFTAVAETEKTWAAEHVVGVAAGRSPKISLKDLRANFERRVL